MAHVKVVPRRNESQDRMIRRFIKKAKKAGIVEEIRERRYYKKRSERKREKEQQRQRTIRRAAEKAKAKENRMTNYKKKRR
tara:strand:+ start:97 stop:339 length:243 start_codon:yes stop_codon:yes gene_type:complete